MGKGKGPQPSPEHPYLVFTELVNHNNSDVECGKRRVHVHKL